VFQIFWATLYCGASRDGFEAIFNVLVIRSHLGLGIICLIYNSVDQSIHGRTHGMDRIKRLNNPTIGLHIVERWQSSVVG